MKRKKAKPVFAWALVEDGKINIEFIDEDRNFFLPGGTVVRVRIEEVDVDSSEEL